ncbi:hypothetical protein DFJ58DRAFT_913412 [Suillus subalutaceus]|uniref:uncharacterized protein n=1 Tax=Suillus subalutaceus TaxID=48586 RepID=UPI001B86DEC5|nr:uncharacterized protein DFJ58DRAFT_913412 [Suillus subalutaceus]KAG1857688.1 hypothetical protein DFJ58DRAFT_913412 [Suillus subalutaceus]
MSSQNGAYDQNLLDEAPAATRAQRQEGYNVDLLDDRPTRPASTQPLKPQTIPGDTDVESSPLTREKIVPLPGAATYASRPIQSFWRTRNGKITIFVIAIVVIGAVVGGAVGGTVGKISSNNNAPPKDITSSTSTASDSSTTSSNQTGVTPATSLGSGTFSVLPFSTAASSTASIIT